MLTMLALTFPHAIAQNTGTASGTPAQPKLIVGIVIDQMAYEFLYRYADLYSDGGFNRLVQEGYSCESAYFNYIPTYTGPGHTCIYTGSVPAVDGIISNDWYDRKTQKMIYCTYDSTVHGVGTDSPAGLNSPVNCLVTTIGDQLQLSDIGRSRVIGIALKDRSSILPAGHMADAAYWYDGSVNSFITSDYYMQTLPQWVRDFNAKNTAAGYLNKMWNTLLPADQYLNSTADSVSWETPFPGDNTIAFPHYMPYSGNSDIIRWTPWGNTLTTDFAKAAITGEKLGMHDATDLLCISYSSTDYIGHYYGPHSVEIEDTYLRLDRDLASLFDFLDKQVGKGNYMVFLTADHGVAPVPEYVETMHVHAGLFDENSIMKKSENRLDSLFGPARWIDTLVNQQIYLDWHTLEEKGKTSREIFDALREFLVSMDGVANVFLTEDPASFGYPEMLKTKMQNSIYPARSGDISILFDPYYEDWGTTGTTHGTHYAYDSHVPLLFYGWHIPHGASWREVQITDIAPTLAAMLHITEPNGCVGTVIPELLH